MQMFSTKVLSTPAPWEIPSENQETMPDWSFWQWEDKLVPAISGNYTTSFHRSNHKRGSIFST